MKSEKVEEIKKANKKVLKAEEDYSFKDFLKRQHQYKETFLARLYKGAEMAEIRKQLKSGNIKMKWCGMIFPKEILGVEHDMVQNSYYNLLLQEKQLKNSLLSDDMSEEEITALLKTGALKKEYKKQPVLNYIN